MFDRTRIFQASKDGYATYRIPGIVATPCSTLVLYCEARRTCRGDWGTTDILMRRSTDAGRTFGQPVRLSPETSTIPKNPAALEQQIAGIADHTFHNPVMIADGQTHTLHFIYCAEYSHCYYRRSTNDGITWAGPVDITPAFDAFRSEYNWRVIATGPGHGIQLSSGRLLVPVWMSTGTGGHAHRPSCVGTIFSDDFGARWEAGDIVVRDTAATPNPSESTATELAGGHVMLNIRNESPLHRRLVTISHNGASGWAKPWYHANLFEPVCSASLIRLSDQRLLFTNPDSEHSSKQAEGGVGQPRENLTARLSSDNGRTWPVARVIDPGASGYSDLAQDTSGDIFCLYEQGTVGSLPHTASLTLARFNVAWLEQNTLNG